MVRRSRVRVVQLAGIQAAGVLAMTTRDRVQWLLILAHLAEVEAEPRDYREHPYGHDLTEEHYPLPTLIQIMGADQMRRDAMAQARALGVTAGDHARVMSWFAGGNRAERKARERKAA